MDCGLENKITKLYYGNKKIKTIVLSFTKYYDIILSKKIITEEQKCNILKKYNKLYHSESLALSKYYSKKFSTENELRYQWFEGCEKNLRELNVYEIFDFCGPKISKLNINVYLDMTFSKITFEQYIQIKNTKYEKSNLIKVIEQSHNCINMNELKTFLRYHKTNTITILELKSFLNVGIVNKISNNHNNKTFTKFNIEDCFKKYYCRIGSKHPKYMKNILVYFAIKELLNEDDDINNMNYYMVCDDITNYFYSFEITNDKYKKVKIYENDSIPVQYEF